MLSLGPLNMQTGGLILAISAWIGMMLGERTAKSFNQNSGDLSNGLFWSLVIGLLFTRLGYSLAAPAVFFQNPLSFFSLNTYQFDLFSGIAGFFLSAAIFASRKSIRFTTILDSLLPFFVSVSVGYAVSTLATGEVYGSPASIPWSISLWGIPRHPVQIYDLCFIIVSIVTLITLSKKFSNGLEQGNMFLLFVIILSLGQVFTIPFRGDPGITYINGVRDQQILAFFILGSSLVIFGKRQFPVKS